MKISIAIGILLLALLCVGIGLAAVHSQVPTNEVIAIVRTENVRGKVEDLLSPTFVPAGRSLLTFDKLFTQSTPSGQPITFLFTGDVLLARSINATQYRRDDFRWAFAHVADELRRADISIVNVETPLVADCPITTEGMIFCGDPRNVQGLAHAGVDIVSLANNHSNNYGKDGVAQTVQILQDANIKVASQSAVASATVRGTSFAVIGVNDTFATNQSLREAVEQKLIEDIGEAKQSHDIVIVFPHWGIEYQRLPSARQKMLARIAIDAGADVVVGAHPHWYQTVELYKGKLISYSLGNFIFDQMWSQETKEGFALKLFFVQKQLVDADIMPVLIENYGQPTWMEGTEKQRVIDAIKTISVE